MRTVRSLVSHGRCESMSLTNTTLLPALVFYEYIVTLPIEVELIWRRKTTFPAMLLLCNRYVLLVSTTASLFLVNGWGQMVRLLKPFLNSILFVINLMHLQRCAFFASSTRSK